MAGLFDTFTIAKRGLNVQQSHINTASHNIANVSTEGYTRQRSVAETTRPFGGLSRFDCASVGQVGTGAEITSIQRVRDSFLDYQFREANSKAESTAEQSEFFGKIEAIVGEPSSTSMQNLFTQFYASFQELSKNPEPGSSARTNAARKAQELAQTLNQTYAKIEREMQDVQAEMKSDVVDINNCLDQIRELNKTIAEVSAMGQAPNDYMDKRDLLLDKLSSQLGIKVEANKFNTVIVKSSDFQSESNKIDNLINSDYTDTDYVRFSYVNSVTVAGNKLTVEYYPTGNGTPETLTVNAASEDEAKEIKDLLLKNRLLIGNDKGLVGNGTNNIDSNELKKLVFKTNAPSEGLDNEGNPTSFNSVISDDKDNLLGNNSKGAIAGKQQAQEIGQKYLNELDKIAATVAYSINAIQTGTTKNGEAAPDGEVYELMFINSKTSTNTANGTKTDDGITAKNITINLSIIDDPNKINASATNKSGEKNGDRAKAMASLLNTKFDIGKIDKVDSLTREQFLVGLAGSGFTDKTCVSLISNSNGLTTANAYRKMVTDLGTNSKTLQNRVSVMDKQVSTATDNRTAVSGVSIDEEMTNLIQFQHAYTANAKIISTIDELLDVVVNGLKR